MTREERLELLKQIEKDIHVCSLDSTFEEDAKSCALHSVIEELEQEPCDDAISREAVIELTFNEPNYTDALNVLTEIRDKVRVLPSVQPSRTQMVDKSNFDIRQYRADLDSAYECGKASVQPSRKGHWIWNDEIDRYVCDKCGRSSGLRKEMVESGEYQLSNFCPNCGAEMVDPQESEDEE